jgi:hypothetical protein
MTILFFHLLAEYNLSKSLDSSIRIDNCIMSCGADSKQHSITFIQKAINRI